jgi:PAS domain S-box-containing protein
MPPGSASPKVRFVLAAAAFAALYFLAAELTSSLVDDAGIAVLWPASGVYLGVMLVAPRQLWPALALGAGLGSLGAYAHAGSSLELSVAFAVPSSAEGLLAAVLVERIARGRFRLDGLHDVSALVVGAAVATALVALSAGAVAAQTFDASFADSWLRWWSADTLGILAIAPLVVALGDHARHRPARDELRYSVGVIALVAVAAFSSPSATAAMAGGALALPVLLWAGGRWGPRAAALGGAGVALAAMHLASDGSGLLGEARSLESGVHILQAFLAALLVSALAFAGAVADWRRERNVAARSRTRLRQVMDSSTDAYLAVDSQGRIAEWSQSAEAMLGWTASEALGRSLDERLGTGAGPATPTPAARELTLRARHRTGRQFPAAVTMRPGADADDGLCHVFVRDLTERERLGSQLDRAQEELERKRAARDRARSELRGTSEELARAGRRIDRLERDLSARDEELARATDERKRVRTELSNTAGDLSREKAANRALEEKLETARAERSGIAEALEGASADAKRAHAEHARLAGEAEQMRAEHTRALDELEQVRAEYARGADDADALRAEHARLADEGDALRAELARALDDADRLRAEHAGVADEAEAARAELARALDDADRIRAEHARVADEADRLGAERSRAEAQAATADRLAAERDALRRSLDEVTAALAGADAERRLLGEHGTELICRYDARGICLYASPAARTLLGWEPDQLVGRPGADLLHPDDRARLLRTRAGGSAATFEARLRRGDGAYERFEVTYEPAGAREGDRPGEVTTTVRAIGERADDDRTRVVETRFNSLFGTLPTASALIGQDGRIRRANLALSRLTGYTRDQLEGTALGTLVDDAEATLFNGRLRQIAAGQVAALRLEQHLGRANGGTVLVELGITPLPAADSDDGRRLHELVVHVKDLTGAVGANGSDRGFTSGHSQTAA